MLMFRSGPKLALKPLDFVGIFKINSRSFSADAPAMNAFSIQPDRADRPAIAALIARHHALMREASPPESCHVMDASELTEAGAVLFSVTDEDGVLGIGALKEIGPGHGEIKSMHVAAEARGRGISKALLAALLAEAKDQGLRQVSLETGSQDVFQAALRLYETFGFHKCPPFADYVDDPNSVFMTKQL